MPVLSVDYIDLSDGIDITFRGQSYHFAADDISLIPGNLEKKEKTINQWLQQAFEKRYLLSDYDPDHRVRQSSPELRAWERIEGDELVVTLIFIKIHILDLGPPVKLNICRSKYPIMEEWW